MPANAPAVCVFTTSLVRSLSRSCNVSPTHTMGFNPFLSACTVRLLTVSSVSPNIWRRSLCPMITYSAPTSLSISALISPVKAPLSAQDTFSAPTLMLLPFVKRAAVAMAVYGTQITTSALASATNGFNSLMSCSAAALVLFIFQFPAMMGVLMIVVYLLAINFF